MLCMPNTLAMCEALHHAVLDHVVAAAAAFFGRLEDDGHAAGEIARLGQIFGRAEQHRGVAVMAAGMHDARRCARRRAWPVISWIGSASMSARRPIVGPSPGGRRMMPTTPVLADAGRHLVAAEFPKLFGDESRGLEHVEIEFRRGVQMAAPGRHFLLHFRGAVQNGHDCSASARVGGSPGPRVRRGFAILASHRLNSTGAAGRRAWPPTGLQIGPLRRPEQEAISKE